MYEIVPPKPHRCSYKNGCETHNSDKRRKTTRGSYSLEGKKGKNSI